MSNQRTKAEKITHFCIDTLAEALHVKKHTYPTIHFSRKAETSFYNPSNNSITIAKHHFNSGIAYFEESAHFLREKLAPNRKPLDYAVQEFFGRIGESIGRTKVANTEYSYLFDNSLERTWSNLESQKKITLSSANEVSDILDDFRNGLKAYNNQLIFIDANKKYFIATQQNYNSYLKTNNYNLLIKKQDEAILAYNENTKNMTDYFHNIIIEGNNLLISFANKINDEIKNIGMHRSFIPRLQALINEIKSSTDENWLNEQLKEQYQIEYFNIDEKKQELIEKSEQDEKYCRTRFKQSLHAIQHYINLSSHMIKKSGENLKYINPVKSLENELLKYKLINLNLNIHNTGYLRAEVFMKKNPNYLMQMPELFRKSDNYIIKNIFDKMDLNDYKKQFEDNYTREINEKINSIRAEFPQLEQL